MRDIKNLLHAETIDQFLILKYLEEKTNLDITDIKIQDKESLLVTDTEGTQATFKMVNKDIECIKFDKVE